MKFVVFLIALTGPLHAELLATFHTSRGNIVTSLQYTKAPKAVANFITLAQGTRARIDAVTGVATTVPLYAGEKFFRVVDSNGFKIIQTGSGTGTNGGGPGYTFGDEFDPTLTHVPYVLSMANSGLSSNGSQIFFTGNSSPAHLNNVHTIFGAVNDVTSRATIDAIVAGGSDTTTILSVSISRTDAAAVAFDEQAQNLPSVTAARGRLEVVRNTSSKWIPEGTFSVWDTFHAARSPGLSPATWTTLYPNQRVGASYIVTLDNAAADKAFYKVSVVRYPRSLTPPNLVNRIVEVQMPNSKLTLTFGSNGASGTAVYSEGTSSQSSPFTLYQYQPGSDGLYVVVQTQLNYTYFETSITWRNETASLITGSQATTGYSIDPVNNNLKGFPLGSGTVTITR